MNPVSIDLLHATFHRGHHVTLMFALFWVLLFLRFCIVVSPTLAHCHPFVSGWSSVVIPGGIPSLLCFVWNRPPSMRRIYSTFLPLLFLYLLLFPPHFSLGTPNIHAYLQTCATSTVHPCHASITALNRSGGLRPAFVAGVLLETVFVCWSDCALSPIIPSVTM